LNNLINHLFNFHKVQLAVFPEFISFLKGRKKIIRIVLDNIDKPFDFELFRNSGFFVKEITLYSSLENNSFGSLVSSVVDFEKNHYIEVKMYSISRTLKELDEFEYAEVYGDILKAGAYLGYPNCCINNVEKINTLNGMWATFYLEQFLKNKIANHFTNRFPITWGGVSIIGELFPCSLVCPKAIGYSQNMFSDVIDFGFSKLSDIMKEHSLRPVYINKSNGEISLNSKRGFEKIKFQ